MPSLPPSMTTPSQIDLSKIDGAVATSLFWHRRDLRVDDNEGLFQAGLEGPVDGVFIFDDAILKNLPRQDRRIEFILSCIEELSELYSERGRRLWVLYGQPESLLPELARHLNIKQVFTNRDYEPSAIARDDTVSRALQQEGRELSSYKDHVIFEVDEIKTAAGGRFAVFTPYKNAWLKHYGLHTPATQPSAEGLGTLLAAPLQRRPTIPTLTELGFVKSDAETLGYCGGISSGEEAWSIFEDKISQYQTDRDYPYKPGVSRLGHHLRFGTLSIRSLAQWASHEGSSGAQTWLSELIWREFYAAILAAQPRLATHAESFIPAADQVVWDNSPVLLEAWKQGLTGYPFVDAAMRELLATGFMHNRARMVTASFLTKDLLCDWRLGEAHFAQWLMDFDFASNNGGWQWSASTGCDAQPYFRIFSPTLQSEKFDPLGTYIRRWVPELKNCPLSKLHEPSKLTPAEQIQHGITIGVDYPAPVVSHAQNRLISIARYKAALSKS